MSRRPHRGCRRIGRPSRGGSGARSGARRFSRNPETRRSSPTAARLVAENGRRSRSRLSLRSTCPSSSSASFFSIALAARLAESAFGQSRGRHRVRHRGGAARRLRAEARPPAGRNLPGLKYPVAIDTPGGSRSVPSRWSRCSRSARSKVFPSRLSTNSGWLIGAPFQVWKWRRVARRDSS